MRNPAAIFAMLLLEFTRSTLNSPRIVTTTAGATPNSASLKAWASQNS